MSIESETAGVWMRHARSDLAIASNPSQPPGVLNETLCFHAQQAVEKAIKAVLTSRGIAFPRTHNIGELLRLLPPDGRDAQLDGAVILTDYAVTARYPGEREPLMKEDVAAAVEWAASGVAWAQRTLASQPESGLPGEGPPAA
jgi:HEPN domain-containing protein